MSALQDLLNDLTSGDEERAENAVPLLVELGEDAIPALLDLTRSPDMDTRWWALRTFAQSPLCRTEWLVPFLANDPAPEVRQCAALGLAVKADESATQPLVHALSEFADSMVGSLAVNALVKIGSAAVPSLIETVTSGVQSARIFALRALAEIKDHRAIPIMNESDGRRLRIIETLGARRLGASWPGYDIYKTWMKEMSILKNIRPSTGQIVFWVIAVVLAVAGFIFVRNLVTCWTITPLPGAVPSTCGTVSGGASRRSISRAWCRCGCFRSPSPAATPSS